MIAQRVLHIRCHDCSLSRVLTDLRAKVTAALQKLIFDAERRRRNALGGMVIDTQLRTRPYGGAQQGVPSILGRLAMVG